MISDDYRPLRTKINQLEFLLCNIRGLDGMNENLNFFLSCCSHIHISSDSIYVVDAEIPSIVGFRNSASEIY